MVETTIPVPVPAAGGQPDQPLPAVGLGLWKVERPAAAGLVEEAIRLGYRHLDSASDYGNEAEVGEGITRALARGLCRREDLWVTSKLWNTYHEPRHVRPAVERSLRDLGLDDLDLYLIHFPIALAFVPFETRYPPGWFFDPDADEPVMRGARVPLAETWAAMEQLVDAGLVRRIGVCNYGVSLLRDLLATARIPPAVLQVEMHPLLAQEKLLRFCRESAIAVTAFSPLGAPSYVPLGMATAAESLLEHPLIMSIAAAAGRTPAQVLLRWGVQRGTAVIPKTSRPERLAENLAVSDFALSSDDMAAIAGLDEGRRFNDPGVFCELAFNTFFPIYE
jgi:D-xylose reductase